MTQLSHYIELKAIPQTDMLQSDVISYCLQKLHQFLPHFSGRIGIAFPAYGLGRTLGGIIRLFGNQEDCRTLKNQLTQHELQDYILISDVFDSPQTNSYRCYSRIHRKGQSALRRAEKRLTEQNRWHEDIRQEILHKQHTKQYFPHIRLTSASTKQKFVLAIKMRSFSTPHSGEFNAYGLSKTATVPHF